MNRLKYALWVNRRIAKAHWGDLPPLAWNNLKKLTEKYALSIAAGDLQLLDGHWYVTHGGLLRLSERRRCRGIKTEVDIRLSDPAIGRWIVKATVYTSSRSRGFTGYGDANPSNVSPLVRGAEMRVAETRAVNRALRKAYGIGLCSVEELGWESRISGAVGPKIAAAANTGHQNGSPRLRDRLCLLIRRHQLDANLVKAYAADFCGTPNLRGASREQIEQFITDLSDWATRDRAALLCKLNSYATPQEVRS